MNHSKTICFIVSLVTVMSTSIALSEDYSKSKIISISTTDFVAREKRIHGSFIQFSGKVRSWTPEQFERCLGYMAEVKMDILIIQWTALLAESYINRIFGPIETLLSKADALGIKVYMGLGNPPPYGVTHPPWEAGQQKALATELWGTYGSHTSFAGWYIPDEYENNVWWKVDEAVGYLSQVADYCHSISGKPVMLVPYFGLHRINPNYLSPSDTGAWWTKVLADAHVDIIAFQDGIGCDRGITFQDVQEYFSAMQKACQANNVKFWSDLEIFNIADYTPADTSRVLQQIEIETEYCETIVCFTFDHYMNPEMGAEQQRLFEDYKRYLNAP